MERGPSDPNHSRGLAHEKYANHNALPHYSRGHRRVKSSLLDCINMLIHASECGCPHIYAANPSCVFHLVTDKLQRWCRQATDFNAGTHSTCRPGFDSQYHADPPDSKPAGRDAPEIEGRGSVFCIRGLGHCQCAHKWQAADLGAERDAKKNSSGLQMPRNR